MIAWIIKTLLNFVGGPVLGQILGHIERKAASEVEKLRIERGVDIEKIRSDAQIAGYSRDVVTAGMQHKMFWVAWSIAAIPMSAWFGWGMLDTLFNGDLPDVATIPPGLKPYADVVWGNIFYTGAAAAGLQGAAAIIGKAISRR